MPLAKSHGYPNKLDRKATSGFINGTAITKHKKYAEADAVVDKIYADICKGVAKSECLQKMHDGLYGKSVNKRNALDYYNRAYERLAYNADIEAKQLRDLLYNRYEKILQECMNNGDLFNARLTLDSMAKIFLGLGKEKATVELKNGDNKITVSFGFNNDEQKDDTDVVDGEIIEDECAI